MNLEHPDVKRAVNLWAHNKVNKREYKNGSDSAALTLRDGGREFTEKYLMEKLRSISTFSAPDVLSYWQGYFDLLLFKKL